MGFEQSQRQISNCVRNKLILHGQSGKIFGVGQIPIHITLVLMSALIGKNIDLCVLVSEVVCGTNLMYWCQTNPLDTII